MLRLRSTAFTLSRFWTELSMWLCRAALVTDVRRKLRACCRSHKPDCTSWAFANALPGGKYKDLMWKIDKREIKHKRVSILTFFFSQTSYSTVVWGTITDSDRVHPSVHDF